MITLYSTINDKKPKWTMDIRDILYREIPARSDETLMAIINEYYNNKYFEVKTRVIFELDYFNYLFANKKPAEVVEACKALDLNAKYFVYDGEKITGINDMLDFISYREFADIVESLVEYDGWTCYEELASVIKVKVIDEQEA